VPKVNLWATLPHYLDHLLPIWRALPAETRGECLYSPDGTLPLLSSGVTMVAGWQDVRALRGRPMIYVEHGAGQTYVGDPRMKDQPGYSGHGGTRFNGVMGFIAPSSTVAARWTTAPSVAVGCPKMDPWFHPQPFTQRGENVCFAWHWESLLCPETRSAWEHYAPRFRQIVAHFKSRGFQVFGHAHPRWEGRLDEPMTEAGAIMLHADADVFYVAAALLCDNSSIAYEFASLGRPVLSLNAPWYRRDIEHGLRFWSHVPGLQVDGPEELLDVNPWEILYGDEGEQDRLDAVEFAYDYTDGHAGPRAAAWIDRLVRGM